MKRSHLGVRPPNPAPVTRLARFARRHRVVFQLPMMLVLLTLVVGPAPGEVGGCGQGDVVADATDHCRQTRYWDCRRQEARMEITADEVQGCVDAVEGMCAGRTWLASCAPFPLRSQSQACIDALALPGNVYFDPNGDESYDINEIPECQLCSGGGS